MASLAQLRTYLDGIGPGPVEDASDLESLLADCWDRLVGDDGGMTPEKLLGRTEYMAWDPPDLTFCIERHGGTVTGSSRAEIQAWTLNVVAGTRFCCRAGHRQLHPMAPRLNVRPIAQEIAQLIEGGKEDPRLKWSKDGTVRVKSGEIIPDDAVKQTIAGRRRRFWAALDAALATTWQRRGQTYERKPAPSPPPLTVP